MENETTAQHVIFAILLICIISLSLSAVPEPESTVIYPKVSKKMHTKNPQEMSVEKPGKIETANAEKTVAPRVKTEPAKPAGIIEPIVVMDVIAMNAPEYSLHKKGIVQFTHKKHVEAYSISCGSCHHDETGKPQKLENSDAPRRCIECHPGTEKPKGEKLSAKQKIAAYHFEALHANCIGCHKDDNKRKGDAAGKGPAPTACTSCHPK